MAGARGASVSEGERLKHALTHLLELDPSTWEASTPNKILKYNGIKGFATDLIFLSPDDIMGLSMPSETEGEPPIPMPKVFGRKLIAMMSFYQRVCAENDGTIEITTCTVDQFKEYLVSEYDHTKPILPWQIQTKDKTKQVEEWTKRIRPSKQDYKAFKDERTWVLNKIEIQNTAASHGLSHLLDEKHVELNKELGEAQNAWMYKVFQDIMIASDAKAIVTANYEKKNCAKIWKEICEKYDGSMVTELFCQEIGAWLSSVRVKDLGWKGSYKTFVNYFMEQARQYNLLSPEPFTPQQIVQFLNNAMIGVHHLENVLNNDLTSRRAAKNGTKITPAELAHLLGRAAATHEAARFKPKFNVNKTEMFTLEDEDQDTGLEINEHDIMSMDIRDLTVMQASTNSSARDNKKARKVYLDFKTWKALNANDRSVWDQLSDEAKTTILAYASKKLSKDTRPGKDRRQINQHEFIFLSHEDDDSDGQIEASVHRMKSSKSSKKSKKSVSIKENKASTPKESTVTSSEDKTEDTTLIDFSTGDKNYKEETKIGPHSDGVDVNMMMSQKPRSKLEAGVHDFLSRDDAPMGTWEVGVHDTKPRGKPKQVSYKAKVLDVHPLMAAKKSKTSKKKKAPIVHAEEESESKEPDIQETAAEPTDDGSSKKTNKWKADLLDVHPLFTAKQENSDTESATEEQAEPPTVTHTKKSASFWKAQLMESHPLLAKSEKSETTQEYMLDPQEDLIDLDDSKATVSNGKFTPPPPMFQPMSAEEKYKATRMDKKTNIFTEGVVVLPKTKVDYSTIKLVETGEEKPPVFKSEHPLTMSEHQKRKDFYKAELIPKKPLDYSTIKLMDPDDAAALGLAPKKENQHSNEYIDLTTSDGSAFDKTSRNNDHEYIPGMDNSNFTEEEKRIEQLYLNFGSNPSPAKKHGAVKSVKTIKVTPGDTLIGFDDDHLKDFQSLTPMAENEVNSVRLEDHQLEDIRRAGSNRAIRQEYKRTDGQLENSRWKETHLHGAPTWDKDTNDQWKFATRPDGSFGSNKPPPGKKKRPLKKKAAPKAASRRSPTCNSPDSEGYITVGKKSGDRTNINDDTSSRPSSRLSDASSNRFEQLQESDSDSSQTGSTDEINSGESDFQKGMA